MTTFQLKATLNITDQDGKPFNSKKDKPQIGKTYNAHIQLTRYDNQTLTKHRDLKYTLKLEKTEQGKTKLTKTYGNGRVKKTIITDHEGIA